MKRLNRALPRRIGQSRHQQVQLGRRFLAPFRIDQQARRWAEFLPFVEAGGYAEPRWWTAAGRAWLAQTQAAAPRYLRRSGKAWQQWRHGRWTDLDPALPACHLTQHEALAWCAWAGRRLPTEAEWEAAALQRPEAFRWGDVWEWTASTFNPYPGFVAHPYRDYSMPWFGDLAGRAPVLRSVKRTVSVSVSASRVLSRRRSL